MIPFTSPSRNGGILAITRILLIICSIIAPKKVPKTFPFPPFMAVPPIATDAMASSSKPSPAFGAVMEVRRDDSKNAESPDKRPAC